MPSQARAVGNKLSLGRKVALLIVSTVLIVGLAGYVAGKTVVQQIASLIDDKSLIDGLEEGRNALASLHRERKVSAENAIALCMAKNIWPKCPRVEVPFRISEEIASARAAGESQPSFDWVDEKFVIVGEPKDGGAKKLKIEFDWQPLKPKFATLSETIATHEHVGTMVPNLVESFTLVFALILGSTGALALFVTWLLSRGVARRVRDLIGYTRQIGKGEAREAPLSTIGSDEIGMLSSALETMTTDLDHTRKKLILSEKMNSWQNVAKKVAHEIKNPLTPLSLVGSELQRMSGVAAPLGNDQLTNFLQLSGKIIEEETASLGRMVKEFTAFARLPQPAPIAEDLLVLVQEFVQRNTVEGGPVFTINSSAPGTTGAESFRCSVDRGMIFQVFHNLVNNSRLAKAAVGPDPVSIHFAVSGSVADDAMILVDISDDGPGVPQSLRDSLFDAYVTTRSTGDGEKGMGLGLTISRKIASDHGGSLELVAENANAEKSKAEKLIVEGSSDAGSFKRTGGATFRLAIPHLAGHSGLVAETSKASDTGRARGSDLR